jgi:hypothetical protein
MEPNPQQFKAGDTVRQYRKKPVVIEAIQWNGKNHREMHDFLGGNPDNYMDTCGSYFRIDHAKVEGGLIILTLEGEHIATIGDWIIKGVKGEFYPCKPDIFAQTYEPAAPSQPAVEVWSVRDNEILLNNTFIFRVNNQLTANVICSELNRLENRVKELEGWKRFEDEKPDVGQFYLIAWPNSPSVEPEPRTWGEQDNQLDYNGLIWFSVPLPNFQLKTKTA